MAVIGALRQAALKLASSFVDDPEEVPTELPEVAFAAERANAHGPGIERPSAKDYDAIAERVIAYLRAGRDLTRADLRDAAWCIWETTPNLSSDAHVLAAYLRLVIRLDQVRPYRSLASSYIIGFRADRPHLHLIGRALAHFADKTGLPWSLAQSHLAIFEPNEVYDKLADIKTSPAMRPAKRLEEMRIGTLPRGAGLEIALHRHALDALRTASNANPLNRLRLVELWATAEDGTLLDPSLTAAAADALLLVFRGETPDREIRDRTIEAAFRLIGDPRFEPHKWQANVTAEAIMRRWLGELSLRIFLDIVGRVSPPEFWQQRRSFWEAVYRASLVDEAWVVLETEGAILARRIFGEHTAFARFVPTAIGAAGGDIGRGVAVLMLKIGSLLVVDWSHGGPCLIWDLDRETNAPDIYRRAYESTRFRKIPHGPETLESHAAQGIFWHSGSDQFVWQDQIATYLQEARGIRLTPQSYRV
jgi:hypothetical protein